MTVNSCYISLACLVPDAFLKPLQNDLLVFLHTPISDYKLHLIPPPNHPVLAQGFFEQVGQAFNEYNVAGRQPVVFHWNPLKMKRRTVSLHPCTTKGQITAVFLRIMQLFKKLPGHAMIGKWKGEIPVIHLKPFTDFIQTGNYLIPLFRERNGAEIGMTDAVGANMKPFF